MWQLDVHLSADGVCVVAHDDDFSRVSGQNIRISRLEDIIVLARETGCGLYIEIKGQGAGVVAWKLLQDADFRFACLGSFNVDWIAELRALACEYPLSVLVPAKVDPLDNIAGMAVDIVHICWRNAPAQPDKLLTDELLQQLKDYQIVLWDEDRTSVLAGLWGKPLLGICSNRPEMLKPYKPDPDQPIDIVCHRGANNIALERRV